MSEDKKQFKILAIDGGGIRGLYSAKILEIFEARFNTRITDHFDLLCGTSTGGLIALALAMGTPAAEIVQFYKTYGSQIFPHRIPLLGFYLQIMGRGKYSNKILRDVLTHLFGNRCLGDSNSLLCIPSYSITRARPYIFRYDHVEGGLARDNSTRCVDVALATSAAPTYFPMIEIESHLGQQLIDGGVCANNPALVGALEALRYFVGGDRPYGEAQILSLETLNTPLGRQAKKRLDRGFLHWRADLVNCFTEGQARMTNYALKQLSELSFIPIRYLRLESPAVSAEQAKLLSLDNAQPEALKQLEACGADMAHHFAVNPEVSKLFTTRKTYTLSKERTTTHG
jgi:uncharacterized protein